MKKYIFFVKFFVAVFTLVILNGCSKERVEYKLEGTWDKVWVEDLSTVRKEKWEFKSDNTLIIYRNFYNETELNEMIPVETGQWQLEMDFKKNPRRIEIFDFKDGNVSYYNGTWLIIRINSENLFVVKKNSKVGRGPFREFVKLDN